MTTDEIDRRSAHRAWVIIDVVLLTVHDGALNVLLVVPPHPPDTGRWTLPSAIADPTLDSDLRTAALRAVREGLGLADGVQVRQCAARYHPTPVHDPAVSVGFFALIDPTRLGSAASSTHAPAAVHRVPDERGGGLLARPRLGGARTEEVVLPLRQSELLGLVVDSLGDEIATSDLALDALPEMFTLRQLQTVHEAVLGRTLNKDSFRRTMHSRGLLEPTDNWQTDVVHRPARLYRRVGGSGDTGRS